MKLNLENIIEVLVERVPEYKNTEYYKLADKDNISSVFGGFGSYLSDRMSDYSEEDQIIRKSFTLLNQMVISENQDVVNVAVVEVFEAIAGFNKAIAIAEKLLNNQGVNWLDKTKENFNAE